MKPQTKTIKQYLISYRRYPVSLQKIRNHKCTVYGNRISILFKIPRGIEHTPSFEGASMMSLNIENDIFKYLETTDFPIDSPNQLTVNFTF